MKYVFVDIDGVLKPGRSYFSDQSGMNFFGSFDPLSVAAINRLCRHANAKIVFNTTWNTRNIFDIARHEGIVAEIAGKTLYPTIHDRLKAINIWLEEHPASKWVSLDDFPIHHSNAILVDSENGISCQNYRDACEILGSPDRFMVLL